MPHSKNADIRYHILDKCFRSLRRHLMEDLIAKCGSVKKRQIYDDIAYMKEHYNAPIVSVKYGAQTFYEYSDKSFSIDKRPITERELHQIKELLLMLSRFNDVPQFDLVKTLITNINNEYSEYKEEFANTTQCLISLDKNEYVVGAKYIPDIYEALVNKIPLRINYKTFHKGDKSWIIHPYFLKQYNNRWYLIGMSDDEHNNIVHVGLDRIINLVSANVPFIENAVIDNIDKYFEDIVGVTFPPERKIEHIVLKFSSHRYPYVKSKPIHKTQENHDEDRIITLDVMLNKELESILLSFGHDIEILEPQEFRERFSKNIKETYEKYFPVQ